MNFNNSSNIFDVKPPFDPKAKKRIKNIVIAVIVLIAAVILISTSYYTVSDLQQAVITTFGKQTSVVDAGIHFKLPLGIQEAILVDVNVFHTAEIGYRTNPDGTTSQIENESKMITGDMNIINVDFFVEYRISDAVKYLYNSESPADILKNITQSRIRDVISSYNVDDVLTVKKTEIQGKIKELIVAELEIYDIGLVLIDIKIQDTEPPTAEVIAAFKAVETAKQDSETAINEAKAYENANIPKAESEKDQLLQNAEFLKQNRINEATRQVAMFEAMFSQYQLNPEINKRRMYYEAVETVLPGVKLYINTGDGSNTSMVLPLDDFISGDSGSADTVSNAGADE
jgi:membrane protease subunit HflK